MCGIVGCVSRRAGDIGTILRQMNDTIVHRGPDDDGYLCWPGGGFAMRRLSIIDLAGGHQPIQNETGTVSVVFNGEIYNYRDLAADLRARGHVFRSHSDTETIVHAYEEFGPDCVHRFNGMFAFALLDQSKRQLVIARDRLGVKPLYYAWDGDTLLFASEIKAIVASGLYRKEIDDEALWHYLTFRYVPAPMTIWRGIRKLPPGHLLTLDLDSNVARETRYWDIPYDRPAAIMSDAEAENHFESLFLDAVRLRLIADVPVGIFLSGGLDSSAVAAAVKEVHNTPLATFSVAFKEGGRYSELSYARQVADRLGTDHHEVVIDRNDFLAFLPELVWFTDEPLADPASVPLYYVSKLARQHVKVVLSGEGADEVLGGYDLDVDVAGWERVRKWQRLPPSMRHGLATAGGVFSNAIAEKLRRRNIPLGEQNLAVLPHMTRYFTSAQKDALWPAHGGFANSDDIVADRYRQAPTDEPLHQLLYVYCKDWLVEDLLMKADKMTMATSVELRVPFLDYRLVEWLAGRPPSDKVARVNGRYRTKHLLRRFCEKRLPSDVLTREKQGFPVPIYDWLQDGLGSHVRERLLKPGAWIGERFSRPEISNLLDRIPKDPKAAQKAWLLYVLQLWAERWL
jgi:asparagine synthase (glutamine-hydrolysing)